MVPITLAIISEDCGEGNPSLSPKKKVNTAFFVNYFYCQDMVNSYDSKIHTSKVVLF